MSNSLASALFQLPNLSGRSSGLSFSPLPTTAPHAWIAVRPRFEQFNKELGLTSLQQDDGFTKAGGVLGCLNRHYYGLGSRTDTFLVAGS
jgi:hypothetical protein